MVPLFSLRSEYDVGIGEILDLIPLVRWAARVGQRVIQLLPINETAPGEASPYNAMSAFAIDPVYISLRAVPDAGSISPMPADGERLPREAIRSAKMLALAAAFESFQRRPRDEPLAAFRAFVEANRDWLDDYALFHAIKEARDFAPWDTWPMRLRDRDRAALRRAARRFASRIEFLRYVQWIAALQWAEVRRAAAAVGVWLKGDLPFVLGRDSADVWTRQDEFDPRYSVGAPPDEFSATGQSWNLPMYEWPRVRASDFAWWRRRAHHGSTLYDLFRIDHIIGFFRTWAMPVDAADAPRFVPGDEAAQRAQGEAFLRAIGEAAGEALPMAEDLGTVPQWVRAVLHAFGVPGYKVFRWERDDHEYRDPRRFDPLSVVTTGTHDTDTLVEWWFGLSPTERRNALRVLDLGADASEPVLSRPLREQMLARLYDAGSAWIILPIQDVFGWTGRINVPATPSAQNWNWRMPVAVDRLDADPVIRELTAWLRPAAVASARLHE